MHALDLIIPLTTAALGVLGTLAWRRRPGDRGPAPRVLLALPGGELACGAIDAAARVARAERATVVPAVVLLTPARFPLDAPRPEATERTLDVLEAVERRLRAAGVAVDARIVTGRTVRHALRRAAEELPHERLVVPAGAGHGGFAAEDVGWLLDHVDGEVLVLRPGAEPEVPRRRVAPTPCAGRRSDAPQIGPGRRAGGDGSVSSAA